LNSKDTGQLSALLSLLERARRAAGQADQADLDASSAANRGRSELDLLGDALRANPARSRELRTSVQLLREALERAKLSALNAGLEGARIGEPLGKALVDLAQDLRDQLNRAVATLEEHSSMLQDLERERERLTEAVENARGALFASHEAQARAQPLKRDLDKALHDIENQVIRQLDSDPETARLLSSAAEQAKVLRESLVGLVARGADGAARELLASLDAAAASTEPKP
jgi:methyl-accepting chemotaxis protein